MLKAESTVLVVIDVQEKLIGVMFNKEELIENLEKLIRGVQVFNIPIIVTEQYPHGLGPTVPQLSRLIPDIPPLSKLSFSCCEDENFLKKLKTFERRQVLVSGIEGHVCVYQTVRDLIDSGYEVYVVTDAISSRTPENKEIGLNLMREMSAVLTSTETALFEMLKIAKGENFKAISQIVK